MLLTARPPDLDTGSVLLFVSAGGLCAVEAAFGAVEVVGSPPLEASVEASFCFRVCIIVTASDLPLKPPPPDASAEAGVGLEVVSL